MTYAHPITATMEAWWREHAGRHDDPQWQGWLALMRGLTVAKLDEMGEEYTRDGHFGMSHAGGCTRAEGLRLLGHEPEPLSGSTRATFAIGHLIEAMALATYEMAVARPIRYQIPVEIAPFMKSRSDAIDDGGTVISIKSAGYKTSAKRRDGWKRYGFAQYAVDGLRATNPGYWAQLQAEMHGHGLKRGLFVCVAKDMIKAMEADPIMQAAGSLTFYVEEVFYDEEWVERELLTTWDLTWQHTREGNAGFARFLHADGYYVTLDPNDGAANKAATGRYDVCSFCDLRNACLEAQ